MRKAVLVIFLSIWMAAPAFAQREFKDIPADHWASEAVYTAVRAGIISGYPDGTFRGKKYVNRYELAVIAAKLAERAGAVGLTKLAEELKTELVSLKREIGRMKAGSGGGQISGAYETNYYLGNILAGSTTAGTAAKGPALSYRLKTSLVGNLDENASIRINLDTMDSGYFGGAQDISTRLFDVEGRLKTSLGMGAPLDIVVTSGPGPQRLNVVSNIYQGLDGYVYWRPWNSISLSSNLMGFDLGGSYTAHQINTTTSPGKAEVNEIQGSLGYAFEEVPYLNRVKFEGVGDYFATGLSGSPKDLRGEINLITEPHEKIEISGKLGIGGVNTRNLAVYGRLVLKDYFETGTSLSISGSKIGSAYLNDSAALDSSWRAGTDVFGRILVQGGVNLTGEITQSVSDKLSLTGKGDIRLSSDFGYGAAKAGSSMTFQGGMGYNVTPATLLAASYLLYLNPTNAADQSSDLATLGLQYKF